MATPLYPLLEKLVEDAWVKLDRDQITPWAFMTAGPPFKCTDFYGRKISYQGIEFDGSARAVFWSRYIEPFLENIIDQVVNQTLRLSAEKNQDARIALVEAEGLLQSLVRRAFARMADIDRRLRGKGYPENVSLKSTASEVAAMEVFIDRRIEAELAMYKPKLWINQFYNEHPFLFWFLTLLVGAAVSYFVN